jgi:hypothetical protein
MPPSSVHFNGSVNLPDAETVMREISARVPTGVSRMTDGETGERDYWISFQTSKFEAMPEFVTVHSGRFYETADDAPEMPQLKLAEGVTADAIQWPNLGYADAYEESFRTFRALQDDDTIAADMRMQLQYPTPLASMAGTIVPEDLPSVSRTYAEALLADLDRAMVTLPHDRIAVQWDIAVEMGLLEGGLGTDPAPVDAVAPGIVACVERVPADVPVGLHLCYGDYGHQHWKQPASLELQVRLANAVATGARRALDFVSFTVPQDRTDEPYFAPIAELTVDAATELYFALVPYHPGTQPAGATTEQIGHVDAALTRSPTGARTWGICTECGMGRARREDIPALLDLHRTILAEATT